MNAGQSTVLHFGHDAEGIDRSWNTMEDDYSLLEYTAPLQGQALLPVNAGQANVQRIGRSRRGISSAVLDEETQLSPVARRGPPERLTQTAGQSVDSMTGRIGLYVLHRSAPRRVVGTPQLQAPLKDLTNPSATVYEGDRNSKKETAVANVQRTGRLGRGISSVVVNEEAQLSSAVSTKPQERPTQTAGHAGDSMVRRVGLSVVRRSVPRRVANTPQLQALLEDLGDPSATIFEGDGNSKEDTAAANVQHIGRLERGISNNVLDEEAQNSPAVSTRSPERPTQTAKRIADSLVRRIGPSVVRRSGPRRVTNTPQLQALPEDLADPSATISKGDRNSEEDRAERPTICNQLAAKRQRRVDCQEMSRFHSKEQW